ncbi:MULTISPECIES: aminotransferase class V-fold PLP-dependent enzyme [unclassified Phenylobacterium]|jgi:selenocysteine lyase/cysteine desulfurase|uniref:aminotransferase class V-fold PLP-dependent enzyme n=1 Tax=unclassified Phenylobacterium TaxID=2640670 RepID=UPI0009EBBE41|nr:MULTISPECIES: aminotransferase class V-fold PLP-dependent enzyme [unclassified Phenylobacterium]
MRELGGRYTRRAALAAVGLTPAASSLASAPSAPPSAEYGFAPGLTYLNTASLGPTPRSIRDVMDRAWTDLETNPVRMAYGQGGVVGETDVARGRIADLLGCAADELLLTRSTTDAMNILAAGTRLSEGDRVLTTDQEHEGGTYCWTSLARRRGIAVDVIPIAPEDHEAAAIVPRFAARLRPTTRVISVSHVISATGHRMPVEQIAALARSRGVSCVVDGAQAWGQIPVDVKAIGCHAYATTGHKWMMGPKGCGVLYLSPDARETFQPVQLEDGHRFVSNATGVGCLPLAIGLGAAAEAMSRRGIAEVAAHNMTLRDRAYEGLASIPGLTLASAPPGHAMGTALVAARLPDSMDSNLFRQAMHDRHRVVVKMAEKRWFNGFRLSPHLFNTEADVDRALAAIRMELS